MTLFGLGLPDSLWKKLHDAIQESTQLPLKTSRNVTSREFRRTHLLLLMEQIRDEAPHLLLIYPNAFQQPADIEFLIKHLLTPKTRGLLQIAFILDNLVQELQPLMHNHPTVTLANQMQFRVSDASVFVHKAPSRFPRLLVDAHMEALTYQAHAQAAEVTERLEDLPAQTLIPLSQIQKIQTPRASKKKEAWFVDFLKDSSKPIALSQVKGFLKEEKGCYLFPGIPVDRIASLSWEQGSIHYCLQASQLNTQSLNFRRLLFYCKQQRSQKRNRRAFTTGPLRIVSPFASLNQLAQQQLLESSDQPSESFESLPPGQYHVPTSPQWVLLHKLKGVRFKEGVRDFQDTIDHILKPLKFLTSLEDLPAQMQVMRAPISESNFLQERDSLMAEEKKLLKRQKSLKTKMILFEQEKSVLEAATQVAHRLIPVLSRHLLFEEVLKEARTLKPLKALLWLEDREQASDINLALSHVPQKLWLCSEDYPDLEKLKNLDPSVFESYSRGGILVVSNESLQHLEGLIYEALRRSESFQEEQYDVLQEQQQTTELLETLHTQKQSLAIQWIQQQLPSILNHFS